MYEDGIDGDFLKEVVANAIKKIDIGAAVLPNPLFRPDIDERHELLCGGGVNDSSNDSSDDNDEQDDDADQTTDDLLDDGKRNSILDDTKSTNYNTYKITRTESADEPREGRAPERYSTSPKIPTRYARTLRNEFNAVVIEHHLKWAPMCVELCASEMDADGLPSRPRLGRYDFHHADAIVDWAIKHNMKVKGHVLVWHVTSPQAILEEMSSEEVREQLRRHIFTTMGHFRGRINVWDVVNEALAPDGTLAENVFFRKIGPGYIEDCFRWAHQADPDAILLYNDNKVEGMNGPNKEKSDGFYHLLASLIKKGVPIHGCGIQAHFNAAGTGNKRVPTPRMVKNQIHRLGKLGLKVNISEMDCRVSQLAPDLRQIAQRQIYHDIIVAALTEPAFDGLWLWGFTDRHTWVTHFYFEDEPLIFDESYERKEAYYALRDALFSITQGGTIGSSVMLDSDEDDDGNRWGHEWMPPSLEDEFANAATGDDRPDWEL